VAKGAAEAVLRQLRQFQRYSFAKSHAVSTAVVAWQECQLRARCPLAFWAAALNNHQGAYPRRVHVEAAKRAGIAILSPCVNRSELTWTQEVTGLRPGLRAIRSLDLDAAKAAVEERHRGNTYESLADFRKRVNVTPQDLALMIRAGAFDFTHRSPVSLLREAEVLQHGRLPPFWEGREEYEPWPLDGLPTSYALAERWREQWELLGFLPGPSLMSLARACVPAGLVDSRTLGDRVGERVRLAGLVAVSKESGTETHSVTLEDEYGLVEVKVIDA
jgi:DNA polymerase-3 subunit alpha